jgi:hypothetical protein
MRPKEQDDFMNDDNILNFLSDIPLFSSLPKDELRRVAQFSLVRSYPKETVLFLQGRSKLDCVYIIQTGEIELYYERENKKTQINFLKEGEIFGGISILMNSGIPVRTAKVIKDAICYTIPADIFQEVCLSYGFFNKYVIRKFGLTVEKDFWYFLSFGLLTAILFFSGIPYWLPVLFLSLAGLDFILHNGGFLKEKF